MLFMVHVVQSNNDSAVLQQSLHKSPFYNGRTTYGGRSAYRHSGCVSPYKVHKIVTFSLWSYCDVMSLCCL